MSSHEERILVSNLYFQPRYNGVSMRNSMVQASSRVDAYFSADVETDGSIPGPYSMLSFGLVYAGSYDGKTFDRPVSYSDTFYRELKPISEEFEVDALRVNQLDRSHLKEIGDDPVIAMTDAARWIRGVAAGRRPVLVAYPLSFDWTFLYWYFVKFSSEGSPFNHSSCFDIKTAIAVNKRIPIAQSGRAELASLSLSPRLPHTHNALEDAIEQAEIFARIFEETQRNGRRP